MILGQPESVSSLGERIASLLEAPSSEDGEKELYESRFLALHEIAHKWGFAMYNRNLYWQSDAEFARLCEQFPLNGQRPDRKFVLWSLANSVRELPGDTAECGVLHGHSSHLICGALLNSQDREHHIFDSFEGLSEPDENDVPTVQTAYDWKQGDLSVALENVKNNLAHYDNVKFYKGWIPSRFDEVADRKFCFVHVDVDLYQPTVDSFHFFFEKIVPGGILLCDDYGSEICPGAKLAFDTFARDHSVSVVHLPTGQGYICKR